MLYDDESDLQPASSSREYLESPGKAKRDALKEKLKKEGLQGFADKASSGDLKGLKLSVLKQQMKGEKDKQNKTADEAQDKKGSSMGTKTREQEIVAQRMSADAKPSTQQTMEQSQQEEKAQEEIQAQEVSGEGG